MRTRSIALTVFSLATLGGTWIAYDDGFGRPQTFVEREEEFRTISMRVPRSDPYAATFSLCAGPVRVNCVVDGDRFWFKGEKVRFADIDAPEISESECPAERQAGEAARPPPRPAECRIVLDHVGLAGSGSLRSQAAQRRSFGNGARGDACRGRSGAALGRTEVWLV